mgnify:CR=1 FL=1
MPFIINEIKRVIQAMKEQKIRVKLKAFDIELIDQFISDTTEFESLAEYKKDVKAKLTKDAERGRVDCEVGDNSWRQR